jgi:hypothetical protein
MNNKFLLLIGVALIGVGLVKPNLSSFPVLNPQCDIETYVIDAPADTQLLDKARKVVDILKLSNDSTKGGDCIKLSALYSDMATLIELDSDDKVISDTASIKEVNSLAGKMLRLDIKDKYPNLAEAARDVVVYSIGEDDVVLDSETRTKAVQSFRALSWAFYEGGK